MAIALGLDVGTSSTKVVALDLDTGKVIAEASKGYPLSTPRPGWAEQDPALWTAAALEVLRAVAQKLGPRASEVVGLGLSGQMHSAVFLDDARDVLRPAILWCDTRTTAECEEIERKATREGLARMVGNAALEGFTLPKLLWLQKHEPEVYGRVRHVLMPKDFVALALTGELGTDVSDASGTLAFSPREGRRADELLTLLGLDPAIFPSASAASAARGTLRAEVASLVGLPVATVVACGAADNAAAALGLGAIEPRIGLVSIGTSGVVLLPTARVAEDPSLRLHVFASAVPGGSYVMGVMLAAGLALRWYRDTLAAEEVAIACARGVDPYTVIEDSAARSEPGARGVVFLPYLLGERTPHVDARASGAFVGVTARTTRDDLARAVMEGIVYGLADLLACASSLESPVAPQVLRATGGGARSLLFRSLLADVLGLPVETTESVEGGALGAAILAAVASGAVETVEQGVARAVTVVSRTEPDPVRGESYRARLAIYRSLYPALRPAMHALSAVPRAGGAPQGPPPEGSLGES